MTEAELAAYLGTATTPTTILVGQGKSLTTALVCKDRLNGLTWGVQRVVLSPTLKRVSA
jgi:hypothetical protein